jgi:hypothetical protein
MTAIALAGQALDWRLHRSRALKVATCLLTICWFFCSRAGDLPASEPSVAYHSVSISLPDPIPTTLPGGLLDSEISKALENGLEPEPTGPLENDLPALFNPDFSLETTMESFSLTDERQMNSLLKVSPRDRWFASEEFVLLRRRMPSRYAYESWANLKTGYGRFFPDEAIARCQTSGVGVEDPDWVYVKMTFHF